MRKAIHFPPKDPYAAPVISIAPRHGLEHIVVKGAREHNLKNIDLTSRATSSSSSPASRARASLARLRHDLRRGAAPLRRVALVLRPPVPRPDGEARRRPHRGAVAGHLDRPEDDEPQPALDGRHGHRDLRLPAAAVCARRAPALPQVRPADRPADAEQIVDQILELPEGTRIQVLAPDRARAQRRVPKLFEEARRRALRASASTARSTSCARRSTSTRSQAHIEVVVDRLVMKPDIRKRLTDSVETALQTDSTGSLAALVQKPARKRRRALVLARRSRASYCGLRSKSSRRACSRSTGRTARARTASVSASSIELDPRLIVPDALSRSRKARRAVDKLGRRSLRR